MPRNDSLYYSFCEKFRLGGYLSAHYAQKLRQSWIRVFVVLVGAGMTVYFFAKAY